ncbi:hypothetical protein P7C70_g3388, partial [Phenoliferia sp. Uapishka_3]
MRPSTIKLSGGAQYPYPKEVWSPAGGWWTRPANWRASTVYVALGVGLATWGVWSYSAEKEWAKQFTSGEMGVRDESALKGASSEAAHH